MLLYSLVELLEAGHAHLLVGGHGFKLESSLGGALGSCHIKAGPKEGVNKFPGGRYRWSCIKLREPRMAMIRQNRRFGLLEFLFGASSLLTSRLLTWSGPHPGLMYSDYKTRCITTLCSSNGSGSSTVPKRPRACCHGDWARGRKRGLASGCLSVSGSQRLA